MNKVRNVMSFMNIGRNQQRMLRRMVQPRKKRSGMWLSLAALALGGAAYSMRRKQINQGIMRAGQAVFERFTNRHEPTTNQG